MLVALVEALSRRQKQAIAVAIDCAMLPFALWCAVAIRYGAWFPEGVDVLAFWPAFAASVLACVPLFFALGLYRHVIRYMGRQAAWAVLKGVAFAAVAITAVAYMTPLAGFPRSAPLIFAVIAFVYVAGTRFLVRYYAHSVAARAATRRPVAIYGAGKAGARLAAQLEADGGYAPVAFIDDDVAKHGHLVQSIEVHPVEALPKLIDEHVLGQVLIAVPSATTRQRRRIIERLEPYPVHVRLMPGVDAIVSGAEPEDRLRDIDIADLLGRDEVAPAAHLLGGSVAGRTVLVTGAGGSIGAELCRQILRLAPRRLVLLDQSEFALFRIENELRAGTDAGVPPVEAVLGSVLNRALMTRTLRTFEVETVYHAAAYKHVGMVENNVVEGIKNNTFGTKCAAECALAEGVADFILISTDKAVRTRSAMGASKRLAEMVLQALQEGADGTRFSMVRFGNVLVSSGSVVPLFLEQIGAGGPVTVTHPDVTRYFMTLSEAASLVLQAGSMATGGDVFVLDMGEPVRIVDLARKMIRLKGLRVRDDANPHGDIAIEFTGLKPGEKLHEELLIGAAPTGTEHRKILRAMEAHLPWSALQPALATLEQAFDGGDHDAIRRCVESLAEGRAVAEQLAELAPGDGVVPLSRSRG